MGMGWDALKLKAQCVRFWSIQWEESVVQTNEYLFIYLSCIELYSWPQCQVSYSDPMRKCRQIGMNSPSCRKLPRHLANNFLSSANTDWTRLHQCYQCNPSVNPCFLMFHLVTSSSPNPKLLRKHGGTTWPSLYKWTCSLNIKCI